MKHIFIMYDIKKMHDFEKYIHKTMQGLAYLIQYTHSQQEIIQFIKQLSQPARIYSVGGDGALNIVVQATVHTQHEVVVIPLGTGNDFCRMLTKEKNPVTLLKQSLKCQAIPIDTIALNDLYFINSACFGVDSIIATHVHDTPHIPLVPDSKSYIVSILQHVFQYQFDEVVIEGDGQLLYKGPVTLCTFNNGQYYGGGFPIIPHANVQDGYMDICVVDKVPKSKIPYLLTFLLRRLLHKRKEVHFFKVKEAHISSHITCNMDGDEVQGEEFDLKVMPQSIQFVMYDKDIKL